MKHRNPKPDKMFHEGVATSTIEWAVSNLPNIMFLVAIVIRIGIGYLLWMHTVEILSILKSQKTAYLLAFIFVVPVEIFLTATSFASAGLWKKVETFTREGRKREATISTIWAIFFLLITLAGSLIFNALMLYWAQKSGSDVSAYFNVVGKEQSHQVLVLVQVLNVFAVVASEGSAFLLNSNFGNSKVTPEPDKVTQNYKGGYSDASARADNLKVGIV